MLKISLDRFHHGVLECHLDSIYNNGQKMTAKAGYTEIRNYQVKEFIDMLNELEQKTE